MGIIDKFTWTLHCGQCGTTEEMVALDKGSRYSGSHWTGPKQPEKFTATVVSEKYGPEVTGAVCKSCGQQAAIKSRP